MILLKCFEVVTIVLIACFLMSVIWLTISYLFLSRALLYAGIVAMMLWVALSVAVGGYQLVSELHLSRWGIGAYIIVFITLSEPDTSGTLLTTDALWL
jgi:hypothetical protein